METESNPELKHFYGQKLLQLLPCLGLGTVRWLSTLLPIISTHTQIPHCRSDGLIILSNILDVCKAKKAEERIKFHVDTIYEPLIRLLYDLNTDEQVFKMSSG